MSSETTFAERVRAASDEDLAKWHDAALADFGLAEKYEHNAHLVPKIRETLDVITAEQKRRELLREIPPSASPSTFAAGDGGKCSHCRYPLRDHSGPTNPPDLCPYQQSTPASSQETPRASPSKLDVEVARLERQLREVESEIRLGVCTMATQNNFDAVIVTFVEIRDLLRAANSASPQAIPTASEPPSGLAKSLIELDALITEHERNIVARRQLTEHEELPAVRASRAKNGRPAVRAMPADPRHGERHRRILAIEQRRLDALRTIRVALNSESPLSEDTKRPETILGMRFVVDHAIPPGEIQFRDNGRVLARLINVTDGEVATGAARSLPPTPNSVSPGSSLGVTEETTKEPRR